MEVAVLNLLILIFVFQGLCAVPEFGKRHPIEIPDPVPVDPVPVDPIPVDPIPVDPIPVVPNVDPIPNSGLNGPSHLGEYIDNNKQTPFSDLTGEWDQFFSRVDDILEAAETDAAADGDNKPNEIGGGPPNGRPAGTPTLITYTITDFCSPVVGGNCATIPTYITVFDPAQPTNACSAWSSLSVYCSGGGTNCACYSGSYYVPDQWNSLAAACAKAATGCLPTQAFPSILPLSLLPLPPPVSIVPPPSLPPPLSLHARSMALKAENSGFWCDLAPIASSYASYCPTNTSTVAFAAVTLTPTAAAPSSPANPSAPTPTGSAATAIEVSKFNILTTALFLVLSAYRIW